ncbi:hypothetical protein K439DRAFT_1410193 [Ramaria rubella]|nr:hypothetical protein K439DRAFT_1410193 [Ramaria rubella]
MLSLLRLPLWRVRRSYGLPTPLRPSTSINSRNSVSFRGSSCLKSTFNSPSLGSSNQRPYSSGSSPPNLADLHPRNWHPRLRLAGILFSGGAIFYIANLEQVPMTGRWRFMIVSPETERDMAADVYQDIVKQWEGQILPANHPLTRHVRGIVNRLLEGSQLGRLKDEAGPGTPGDTWYDEPKGEMHEAGELGTTLQREWNLVLVADDEMVNAVASNGTIVVFTGIMPVCKSDDGLAAVLGHEIAHVVARHSSERISSVAVFHVVAFLIDFISSLDIGSIVTRLALDLPNSRTQELEADRIGLSITAKACYNPQAAPEVQRRLDRLEKSKIRLDILSTHPLSQKRARILEALLPEAYALRAKSPACAGMEEQFNAFEDTASSFAPEV